MAEVRDKAEHPRPAPDTPVQYVRAVDLEARLNKIVLQLEAQNKAWEKCLIILTQMNTILFEKYKSQDRLLEEHPPVKGPAPAPAPVPATSASQPQPFNNYSDSIPYGTELEEEREAPSQSFPPRAQTDIPEQPEQYSQRETVPTYSRMPQRSTPEMGPEYTQGESPTGYGDEPHGDYNDDPVSESAVSNSADSATQQPRMIETPGPPVSSKAELLERVEKVP